MTSQLSGGVVCCVVGGEQFALRAADVRLVARADQMIAQAGRDGRVGVLRHGGAAVPVYGLAALFGLPPHPTRGSSHIVVTSGKAGMFGVLVDRAVRISPTERFDVLPLPAFVGPSTGRWFDGLLHGSELSCLLVAPAGIDPERGPRAIHPRVQPRAADVLQQGPEAAEIVVLFRTPVLPSAGGDRFALGARRIAAVVQGLPSVPLPGAPPFVTGLSWWQDAAVPLVDFSERYSRAPRSRHLLVRTREGAFAGLPVEADLVLRRATAEHRHLRAGAAPFVTGVFAVGDEKVALIDVDALIAADTRALVASCAG